MARCISIYQAVKAEFLSDQELTELRADPLGFGGAQGSVAFLRFMQWQDENAERVAALRAEARASLDQAGTGY